MKKPKVGILAHRPLSNKLPPLSAKEENEIAKDLVLMDILAYSAEEIKDLIQRQIVSFKDVEEVLSPSNA